MEIMDSNDYVCHVHHAVVVDIGVGRPVGFDELGLNQINEVGCVTHIDFPVIAGCGTGNVA